MSSPTTMQYPYHSPWASNNAQTVDHCEDDEEDCRWHKTFNVTFITEYVNSMANEDFGFWICLLICMIILLYIVYYAFTFMSAGRKSPKNVPPPIY